MAKVVDYFASIKSGTNRVVGQADNDWETIRDGSHLKFVNDPVHYLVASTKKYFFIKSFTSDDGKSILIPEDTGIEMMLNDTVTVSYKDYEVIDVVNITNGGSGYSLGDSLQLSEFNPSLNNFSNSLGIALFKVDSVNQNGEITSLNIDDRGSYHSPIGDEEVSLVGGSGSSVKVKLLGNLKANRSSIERSVVSVDRAADGGTRVFFNYSIPQQITDGKASVHKWELRLSSDYRGSDKIEQVCTITRDFTQKFGFPLMAANAMNGDIAHNESVRKIDTLISDLQNKVQELEEKVNSLEDK